MFQELGTLVQDPETMLQDPGMLFQDPGAMIQDHEIWKARVWIFNAMMSSCPDSLTNAFRYGLDIQGQPGVLRDLFASVIT